MNLLRLAFDHRLRSIRFQVRQGLCCVELYHAQWTVAGYDRNCLDAVLDALSRIPIQAST